MPIRPAAPEVLPGCSGNSARSLRRFRPVAPEALPGCSGNSARPLRKLRPVAPEVSPGRFGSSIRSLRTFRPVASDVSPGRSGNSTRSLRTFRPVASEAPPGRSRSSARPLRKFRPAAPEAPPGCSRSSAGRSGNSARALPLSPSVRRPLRTAVSPSCPVRLPGTFPALREEGGSAIRNRFNPFPARFLREIFLTLHSLYPPRCGDAAASSRIVSLPEPAAADPGIRLLREFAVRAGPSGVRFPQRDGPCGGPWRRKAVRGGGADGAP